MQSEAFRLRIRRTSRKPLSLLPAASCSKGRRSARRLPDQARKKLLFPCKDRLLQFGHARVAACEHLAELVDQRSRRRMDELALVTKPDNAPVALRNRDEVERLHPFDVFDRDPRY